MDLRQLEHPSLEIQTIRPLVRLEAVLLYYCFRGRNAYYRTWTTHYFPGCMHQSLASARYFVEGLRAQGSVFYIHQLPSLLLVARDYCAVVTQINSENPLKDYSFTALAERDGWISRRARDTAQIGLALGQTLEAIVSSFAYDSNFWVVPQPRYDSVVVLGADGAVDGFESLPDAPLLRWTSRAQEPLLEWREEKSDVTGRAVLNLRSLYAGAI